MVTLNKLIEEQKWNGMTDIQVIKTFFDLNNLEEEGIDLITELSKSKVEKLKLYKKGVTDWISYLPSKYLYENYDLETADHLHTLELDYISNGYKLSEYRLGWAKENIPNIELPTVYFRPLIEWLDEQGIRFKKQEPIKNKMFMEYV